eukprot:11556016-Karenia_brevis.AAC.1
MSCAKPLPTWLHPELHFRCILAQQKTAAESAFPKGIPKVEPRACRLLEGPCARGCGHHMPK